MEETLERRTVLVIERDGASHVLDIPMGELAPRASINVYYSDRKGYAHHRMVEVYYAGAGVYYEQEEPCPTVQQ